MSYNGSGRAPLAAAIDWYLEQGIESIDPHSPHAVTIPGAVDAWVRMIEDHGTMGLDKLLQPAIGFARGGYPVSPRVAFDWGRHAETVSKDAATASIFLPRGKVPSSGDMHAQPLLADTLSQIAAQGRDGFYKGAVARDLVSLLRSLGGLHSMEDFETAQGEYAEPISSFYRGYEVVECPPNGQGLTALILLNILTEFGMPEGDPLSADRLHLEIEAARLAYQERNRYVADPAVADVPITALLSREHTRGLCAHIDRKKAMPCLPQIDLPGHGDTIYLCVVDRDNNAVSMINSIYTAFGSGLTGRDSGVLLQNRGVSFSLDPNHVNCIAPGKRPLHTIIPGMLKKDQQVVMPFGVMGGRYQPMGHAHLLSSLLDFGLDIQEAIDLARVYPSPEGEVEVEEGIGDSVCLDLANRGHTVICPEAPIGGGQAIWINWEKGVLVGGSDPRKDGCALGF